MAAIEAGHVQALRRLGRRLLRRELRGVPERGVDLVETVPAWSEALAAAVDLDMETALAIADEAENHAANYYEALAAQTAGELQLFFMKLAQEERSHAGHIGELVEEAERVA